MCLNALQLVWPFSLVNSAGHFNADNGMVFQEINRYRNEKRLIALNEIDLALFLIVCWLWSESLDEFINLFVFPLVQYLFTHKKEKNPSKKVNR